MPRATVLGKVGEPGPGEGVDAALLPAARRTWCPRVGAKLNFEEDDVSQKRETQQRILSGCQPTGSLHLGNYLGAVRQWIDLQDHGEGYYFIANYHALTSIQDREDMLEHCLDWTLDSSLKGSVGFSGNTDIWTYIAGDDGLYKCEWEAYLYCIEQ